MKEMKPAIEFVTFYEEAKTAIEHGGQIAKCKRDMILDARKAYNNAYGVDIKSKFNTRSMYVSPEGMVLPDLYAESVIARIPSFSFKTSKEYSAGAKHNLNGVLKDAMAAHKMDAKILPIAIAGFRDGAGIFEVYPKEIKSRGWKLEQGEEGDSFVEYDNSLGYALEIDYYDMILNEVLIDPLANPVDVAGSARYIIVKWGDFSIKQIKSLAESKKGSKGWNIDPDRLFYNDTDNIYQRDALDQEGMKKPESISIHKIYYQDGTIDYVANKRYLIGEKIMNNKMIREMPLIVFIPIPGGGTPYGRSVWDMVRNTVDVKSGCVNLSADNTAKNITASIVTDSMALSNETDAYDLFRNKIIYIEGNERPVQDRLSQIQVVDMTQGLQFLHGVATQDLQKITKISDLSLGSPNFSPRTDGVVQAMNQGAISNTALFLKQTEDTLFQPLAKHILKIFYNYYPKFELGAERELFNVSNIRVQKGTSLEGAQGTQLSLLASALQMALQMPMDWNTLEILKAYFKEAGLPEIEVFLASPEEAIMKSMLALQIPQQQAQAFVQQVSQLAQRARQEEQ